MDVMWPVQCRECAMNGLCRSIVFLYPRPYSRCRRKRSMCKPSVSAPVLQPCGCRWYCASRRRMIQADAHNSYSLFLLDADWHENMNQRANKIQSHHKHAHSTQMLVLNCHTAYCTHHYHSSLTQLSCPAHKPYDTHPSQTSSKHD